jgi:hypothetical protein
MFNPFDDSMIELYEAAGGKSIDFRISRLTDEEILRAVKSNETYERTGKWPAHETVMHQLWEEFGSDPGSKFDFPRWKALNFFYYLISKEAARRWSSLQDQSL